MHSLSKFSKPITKKGTAIHNKGHTAGRVISVTRRLSQMKIDTGLDNIKTIPEEAKKCFDALKLHVKNIALPPIYELAVCLKKGIGTNKDLKLAYRYALTVASVDIYPVPLCVTQSNYLLGSICEKKSDYVSASEFYNKSLRNGYKRAANRLTSSLIKAYGKSDNVPNKFKSYIIDELKNLNLHSSGIYAWENFIAMNNLQTSLCQINITKKPSGATATFNTDKVTPIKNKKQYIQRQWFQIRTSHEEYFKNLMLHIKESSFKLMYLFAMYFREGVGTDIDMEQSYHWASVIANSGISPLSYYARKSKYLLGRISEEKGNTVSAIRYYGEAFDSGCKEAAIRFIYNVVNEYDCPQNTPAEYKNRFLNAMSKIKSLLLPFCNLSGWKPFIKEHLPSSVSEITVDLFGENVLAFLPEDIDILDLVRSNNILKTGVLNAFKQAYSKRSISQKNNMATRFKSFKDPLEKY